MKPRNHCALALTLLLAFTQPARAFDEVTDKFVRLFTASYLLHSECDGQFEINNAQFKREADKAGFDWRRFVPPVMRR